MRLSTKSKTPSARSKRNRRRESELGVLERLEERCLLAPTVLTGTVWQPDSTSPADLETNGFVSVRLLSTVTGRIEADPTGQFGDDVYVVSRGLPAGGGGLIPPTPPDAAGTIYRVDPYATLGSGFGIANPAENKKVFGFITGGPGASVPGEGLDVWFDIAFDISGAFTGPNGGPTMFVSVADADVPAVGVNPLNGIYAFLPDGTLVSNPTPPFNTNMFAFSRRDVASGPVPDRLDNVPAAIAVAPGGSFGTDLYVMDGLDDDPDFLAPGTPDLDQEVIYRVSPGIPAPIDLDATAVLNPDVGSLMPPIPVPPNDPELYRYIYADTTSFAMGVRAMVFNPTGGVITGGQYGSPAYQLYGGMFLALSDVTGVNFPGFGTFGLPGITRILHFPTISSPPVDLIAPRPTITDTDVTNPNEPPMLIGDMAIDHVGFFGGGLFITDYQSQSVIQIVIDPVTGTATEIPFASGFNVPDPDVVGPAQALRTPFSITFSRDGQIMFVSDADGVWAFYANTLAHTPAGSYIGLTDLKELRSPYDGSGFAAAVIDTGVDGDHLGFQGTVAPGFNPAFAGPGNVDTEGHGTAVAGIIHQIAPEAIIVPVNTLGFGFTAQDLYNSVKWVRQNPFADDPRTLRRERYPIVAVNMSLGIRLPDDPDNNVDSDRQAVLVNKSEAIPLKAEFQRYYKAHRYGIVPVGSAGNEGQFFNGMDGSIIPAVLNEVVEVIAAYPYGPTPPGEPPPITSDQTLTCELEEGDEIAFPGKIAAFSSRNQVSDYAAPGTCVSTFGRSLLGFESPNPPNPQGTAPINPTFNGTSASAPIVSGSFVLGYDVLDLWNKVRRKGGVIRPNDPALRKLHMYLTRDLSGVPQPKITLRIPRSAFPNFAAYLRADGVNSIFQWTAVPREDVNIGASFDNPTGTDDDVEQQRLLFSSRYRTYSHINIANFIAAVEGSVALRYFRANPQKWRALARAAGRPGIITVSDIDAYVANPANDATSRAMARLLGGGDRLARINRFRFLDLVADERPDNWIGVRQLNRLIRKLLPGPNSFPIQNRWKGARKGYALDAQAMRNYRDLLYLSREHMLWGKLPPRLKDLPPAAWSIGTRGNSPLMLLPIDHDTPVTGGSGQATNSFTPVAGDSPLAPPGTDQVFVQPGVGNTGGLNVGDVAMTFTFGVGGSLNPYLRDANGGQQLPAVQPPDGVPGAVSYMAVVDTEGADNYEVYGLAINGHLIRYTHGPDGWSVQDVTAATGGPALRGGLQALRLQNPATGAEQVLVVGITDSGRLVEYLFDGSTWTHRTVLTQLPKLRPALLAMVHRANDPDARKGALLYAVSRTGKLQEIVRTSNGTWVARPVATIDGRQPQIVAGLVAQEVTENGRIVRRVFGTDKAGHLIMYQKRGRRWIADRISLQVEGPRLRGDIDLRYDPATGQTVIVGVSKQGQVVAYSYRDGQWNWTQNGQVAGTGDVAVSESGDRFMVESVDGAIAELLFEDGLGGSGLNLLGYAFQQDSQNGSSDQAGPDAGPGVDPGTADGSLGG